MEKFIFLGAGSPNDPSFEGTYSKDHLKEQGITVINPTVIESCHGCPDLMTQYSEELQDLVDNGNKVVAVLEGGLYFTLPSIQATQVTFPIISCPLDLTAYQGFIVPPGHAVIGTVGIERKVEGIYETTQRKKAIDFAEKILNFDENTVVSFGEGKNLDRLEKELSYFNMKNTAGGGIILNYENIYDHMPKNPMDRIQIWTDPNENLLSGNQIEESEKIITNSQNTLQVRGIKNLAIYAAKILSLENPELREKIKGIAIKKRGSYEERDIIKEYGGK